MSVILTAQLMVHELDIRMQSVSLNHNPIFYTKVFCMGAK